MAAILPAKKSSAQHVWPAPCAGKRGTEIAMMLSPHGETGENLSKARWFEDESSSRFSFLFAHDLIGKPLHTFPDHALVRRRFSKWRASGQQHARLAPRQRRPPRPQGFCLAGKTNIEHAGALDPVGAEVAVILAQLAP